MEPLNIFFPVLQVFGLCQDDISGWLELKNYRWDPLGHSLFCDSVTNSWHIKPPSLVVAFTCTHAPFIERSLASSLVLTRF